MKHRTPPRPAGPPPAAPVLTAPAPAPNPMLWVVVAFALGLRVWHLGEGLPDFFEEAFPFRRAFDMAGWETGHLRWNPQAFHYPSLSFYMHMVVQWAVFLAGRLTGRFGSPADFYVAFATDPTPMAIAARLVGLVADLATVLAVGRIGERWRPGVGILAALLAALSTTLIHHSRAIVTDGMMTALAAWSLERMLAYRAQPRNATLATAALLAGLAAGTKYPALLLAVPLAWATYTRDLKRWIGRMVAAKLGLIAVFLVTSPFLFADLAKTRFDLLRVVSQLNEGELGSLGHAGAPYYLGVFARDFGWLAPLLLLGSLFGLRFANWRRAGLSGVWLFAIAFLLPAALGRLEFERYLLPVLPAAALLMAWAALELPDRLPSGLRLPLRAALVLGLIAPAGFAGFRAAAVGGDTTQGAARRFLEGRVGEDALLVEEAQGAALLDRWEAMRVAEAPAFERADSTWRRRFFSRRMTRVVKLPLLVSGRAVVMVPDSGGAREVKLFESSADLNRVFYEPALYHGVDWVATSDAVRGRYLGDPARFAAQAALYDLLDHEADSVAVFRSGGTTTGPEIRVYRLGDRARAAIAARGPLDSLWWTRDVPMPARLELDQALRRLGSAPYGPDVPPLWVLGLGALFEQQIEPFCYSLALELGELGRCDPAMRLADAVLFMNPGHVQATGIVATCAESRGEPGRAIAAIARLLATRDPEGRGLPDIRLEYVRLLAQTGARDRARVELDRLLSSPLSAGAARRAREMTQQLERDSRP